MSKRFIYIVEDEPMIARIEQVNLESAGYEIAIANDGVAAWEALSSDQICPDLILLDLTLPYLDGFELLRRVKADPKLATIPVMVTSARSLDKDISVAMEIGAAHYLIKPINPAELIRSVKSVMSQEEKPPA